MSAVATVGKSRRPPAASCGLETSGLAGAAAMTPESRKRTLALCADRRTYMSRICATTAITSNGKRKKQGSLNGIYDF